MRIFICHRLLAGACRGLLRRPAVSQREAVSKQLRRGVGRGPWSKADRAAYTAGSARHRSHTDASHVYIQQCRHSSRAGSQRRVQQSLVNPPPGMPTVKPSWSPAGQRQPQPACWSAQPPAWRTPAAPSSARCVAADRRGYSLVSGVSRLTGAASACGERVTAGSAVWHLCTSQLADAAHVLSAQACVVTHNWCQIPMMLDPTCSMGPLRTARQAAETTRSVALAAKLAARLPACQQTPPIRRDASAQDQPGSSVLPHACRKPPTPMGLKHHADCRQPALLQPAAARACNDQNLHARPDAAAQCITDNPLLAFTLRLAKLTTSLAAAQLHLSRSRPTTARRTAPWTARPPAPRPPTSRP